jgi:NADPH:quinone reductase-like Zn-dependent oxidoreductase
MTPRMGANVVIDYRAVDVLAEVKRLTGGEVDVAIETPGTQQTFKRPEKPDAKPLVRAASSNAP